MLTITPKQIYASRTGSPSAISRAGSRLHSALGWDKRLWCRHDHVTPIGFDTIIESIGMDGTLALLVHVADQPKTLAECEALAEKFAGGPLDPVATYVAHTRLSVLDRGVRQGLVEVQQAIRAMSAPDAATWSNIINPALNRRRQMQAEVLLDYVKQF